jgi:hypothetical protein
LIHIRMIRPTADILRRQFKEMTMRSGIRLALLAIPALAVSACTTLSDKDRALLDSAVQTATAAKQEADQALSTAQQALQTAQAAQAAASQAQATAGTAAANAQSAALAAAQSAADAKDLKDKAERMFERSLRKP